MRPDEGRELQEYGYNDLLEYYDSLYERLQNCDNAEVKRILRNKMIEVTHHLNAIELIESGVFPFAV